MPKWHKAAQTKDWDHKIAYLMKPCGTSLVSLWCSVPPLFREAEYKKKNNNKILGHISCFLSQQLNQFLQALTQQSSNLIIWLLTCPLEHKEHSSWGQTSITPPGKQALCFCCTDSSRCKLYKHQTSVLSFFVFHLPTVFHFWTFKL